VDISSFDRSLEGMKVAISVSESDNPDDLGSKSDVVNRFTVRLAEMLLSEGAQIVFGHNWRQNGVMEAIHRAAIQYRGESPAIVNLLPWPDEPGLSEAERHDARATIRILQPGLPQELQTYEQTRADERPNDWLRARALTHMRRELTERADALVCLGGRTRGSKGRYPGIVEEAYLMTQTGKPVYLSALLGGAARDVVHVVERADDAKDCLLRISRTADEVSKAFAQQPPGETPDARLDVDEFREYFLNELTLPRLAERSGLDREEYSSLVHASAFQQILALLLRGLRRVRPNRG
jgi:hypothetical protein